MNDWQMVHEQAHDALRNGCGVLPGAGDAILLRGGESADFLQRLSTNDVSPLRAGSGVSTVLTTEKGRVIDRCHLLPASGGILALATPGRGSIVREWLDKYIIMEDISIIDLSSAIEISCLLGPQAISRTSAPGSGAVLPGPIDPVDWTQASNQVGVITPGGEADGRVCYIVGERTFLLRDYLPWLLSGGATMLPPEAFDAYRVLHGIVLPGVDSGEGENPLESPLRNHVSFSKGCYIGQEVIARLDTYKKLQRTLRPLVIVASIESKLPPGKIFQSGTEVGYTTTHARCPGPWRAIAMGYIRLGADMDALEYVHPDQGIRYPAYVPKDATW